MVLTCPTDRTSSRLRAMLRIPSVLVVAKLFSAARLLSFCEVLCTATPQQIGTALVVVLIKALNADQHCLSIVRPCLHPQVQVRHWMSELSPFRCEVTDSVWLLEVDLLSPSAMSVAMPFNMSKPAIDCFRSSVCHSSPVSNVDHAPFATCC